MRLTAENSKKIRKGEVVLVRECEAKYFEGVVCQIDDKGIYCNTSNGTYFFIPYLNTREIFVVEEHVPVKKKGSLWVYV